MCPQKSVTVVFRVANLTELKFKYLSNDMNYILYIYIYINSKSCLLENEIDLCS
jgi:hypothetical protein